MRGGNTFYMASAGSHSQRIPYWALCEIARRLLLARVRPGRKRTNVSFALLLGPLLQAQNCLEDHKLGLSKCGLLSKDAEFLGMLALQSRPVGARRSHGS